MSRVKPLLLVILDGFGVSLEKEGNPVAEAKVPLLNEIERFFPWTVLQASGVAVGLPWGEAGNSEVGHLTIGAGQVIHHHLPRIINAIHDGSFFKNEAFLKAAEHVKKNKSRLHIAGLLSSGSVHSYIDHLYALLDFTKQEELPLVYLHVFTDGKDSPPTSAAKFLDEFGKRMEKEWPNVRFASVVGRFYPLDRDEKWERIEVAYKLLREGDGEKITSIPDYLRFAYESGITDEFIEPAVVQTPSFEYPSSTSQLQAPVIQDGDALIFFNFREDSMREIAHAFADRIFPYFQRRRPENFLLVTMTEYAKGLDALVAFPPLEIRWTLAEVLAENGLKQIHIAETQKYAHVTYFFNGGREKPYRNEEWVLVPSLSTPHFDEVPAMRSPEITKKIMENLEAADVIIANFANADMVGHSGNFKAAVKAVEALDHALEKIVPSVLEKNGVMIVTGDHGNIELKRDILTGEKLTEHSLNPVPFYLIGNKFRRKNPLSDQEIAEKKKDVGGILTDVAPTILELLGIDKPPEMTGHSLLPILL